MPTIEVDYEDLCALVGKHINLDTLKDEAILYAKGEVDEMEGLTLKIDIKDTNRPDLWSAEGIARELRGRYVSGGLPAHKVSPPRIEVIVDRKLRNIRPYTVCAVVKNLKITPDVLSQMIQLQEKISGTFGKNRREVAIGVYDLHKINPPIRFTTVKPDGIKFVPLDFERLMTPGEILRRHPKGMEFAHLLEGFTEYPLFIDSSQEVLSMPPIINSNHTGRVTEDTRDIFIECSGFNFRFLLPALNVIVTALADRGGEIEAVKVTYPDGARNTPDLAPGRFTLDTDYANRVSGLNLSIEQMQKLLGQARYDVKARGKKLELLCPAYRQDIMHPRDIVEDIVISYGYNNVTPEIPHLHTSGGISAMEKFTETVTELMLGLGLQEILSYTLTNKSNLFEKMNLPEEKVVEIENVVSSNWSVFRNKLLPSLLEFLSRNKHREYPQRIFEAGDVVVPDEKGETRTRDIRKLSAAVISDSAGYEEISSILDALLSGLGLNYTLRATPHPSFIKGRAAGIMVKGRNAGIIGELHPFVLNSWKLEKSVVCFELDLKELLRIISKG